MESTDRADALLAEHAEDGYVFPAYEDYCFSNVPGTAGALLGSDVGPRLPNDVFDGIDTDASIVVVFLLDALGYDDFVTTAEESDFLRSFAETGAVTPLTSTFPSETAACVTTVETGRSPLSHGMLGWNGYDPEADVVYETLPFEATDGGDLALSQDELFDGDTVYDRLAADGVSCHSVQPFGTPSEHATDHVCETVAEFAVELRDVLEAARDEERTYVYAYWPEVDTVGHHVGPNHDAYPLSAHSVLGTLERALAGLSEEAAEDTLFALTADHGQVDVGDGPNVRLDEIDGVLSEVPRDRSGTPIVLGGPRNVHLTVEGDRTQVVRALDGSDALDALVFTREEAVDRGLWGSGEPGPAFHRNCGDVVVVPRAGMVWHGDDPGEFENSGMHGGLARREMLVPFAAGRLDRLLG